MNRAVALWGAAVGAQLGDIATTAVGLGTGAAEAHPAGQAVLSGGGFAGLLLLKMLFLSISGVLFFISRLSFDRAAWAVPAAAAGHGVGISIWNLFVVLEVVA